MESVALILLNYNDYETTIKFLQAVEEYKNINNIIVVDNNSTDESYEKLLKYQNEKIHVIKSEKNGGYSYGNNYGIKYAINNINPEYLIISNPDVFFEENIVDSMKGMYKKDEKIAIVAPTMTIKGEVQWTSWKIPTYKDDIIATSDMLRRRFGDGTAYDKEHFIGDYSFVDVLPGSLFMIPTKIMQEVGMFDEDVFLYCEERILSRRLLEKGYRNVILNNEFYDHKHSASIGKSIDSSIRIYKILTDSTYLYQTKYNNINFVQKIFYKTLVKIMILRMKLG